MSRHLLRDDEAFESDGHLSDLALTALADGQDEVMPPRALEHASACDACTERLGELALLAVSVGDALTMPGVVRASEPVRRPLPSAAIAIACVLAVIGAIPSLLHAPSWLPELPATLMRSAPVTLRAAMTLVRTAAGQATLVTIAWFAAAIVLVAIGLTIARLAPRQAIRQGVGK